MTVLALNAFNSTRATKAGKGVRATRTFEGYACLALVTAQDGLCVTLGALRGAVPRFLSLGGPILEKHDGRAVGRVTGAHVDQHGLYVEAEIHEAVALAKIAGRIYCGWSIGFRFARSCDLVDGAIIGLDLDEVSICESPSCRGCLIRTSRRNQR